MFWFLCCGFHQSFVVKKFKSIHFLSVLCVLFILHLSKQNFLMFLIDVFKILLFFLLVIKESSSIFLPDLCLLCINLFLVNLFLMFFINLTTKILSHLLFLLLSSSSSSFFFFLLLFKLIFNMLHHFLIFSSDLLLLILDHWISKRSHNSFNFFLSLTFFLFSFSF